VLSKKKLKVILPSLHKNGIEIGSRQKSITFFFHRGKNSTHARGNQGRLGESPKIEDI
jgi:hypothetical protein